MPREAKRGGFSAPQRSPEELSRVLAQLAATTSDPRPRRLRRVAGEEPGAGEVVRSSAADGHGDRASEPASRGRARPGRRLGVAMPGPIIRGPQAAALALIVVVGLVLVFTDSGGGGKHSTPTHASRAAVSAPPSFPSPSSTSTVAAAPAVTHSAQVKKHSTKAHHKRRHGRRHRRHRGRLRA